MDHVEKLDGPWSTQRVVYRDGLSHWVNMHTNSGSSLATLYVDDNFEKADYMAAAPEMYDLIAKLANSKIDLVLAEAKAREIVSKIKEGDYRT